MTTRRQQRRHQRKTRMRRLAALVMAAACAYGAGMATSTALANEPQRCGTSDSVCYAGYNANGLKLIADDLSENGKDSPYYATMETNLQRRKTGSITLSDGSALPFRLIGILHDDLADGSGRKAGLTFMSTAAMPTAYCMNGTMPDDDTTTCTDDGQTMEGGWRDSSLRGWLNDDDGPIWAMFPQSFRTNVATVAKQSAEYDRTDKQGRKATATSDRLWIVSQHELGSIQACDSYDQTDVDSLIWIRGCQARQQEGDQYELFREAGVSDDGYNSILAETYLDGGLGLPDGSHGTYWWTRTIRTTYYTADFLCVGPRGQLESSTGNNFGSNTGYRLSVVPAFSF